MIDLEELPLVIEHENEFYYRLKVFEDTLEAQKATIKALEKENAELKRALAS